MSTQLINHGEVGRVAIALEEFSMHHSDCHCFISNSLKMLYVSEIIQIDRFLGLHDRLTNVCDANG